MITNTDSIARLFPYHPDPDADCGASLDELAVEFRKWEAGSAIPILLFSPLMALLWQRVFLGVQTLALISVDPGVFLAKPTDMFWWLLAAPLGLLTSALPTHLLYTLLLGERYAQYTHYVNLRTGIDGWKLIVWIFAGCGLFYVVVVPVALGYYTCFSQDKINVHETFALHERDYRYSDIEELRWQAGYKSRGDRRIGPKFVIMFRDGSTWAARTFLFDPSEAEQHELARFVSEKTGLPVAEYQRTVRAAAVESEPGGN